VPVWSAYVDESESDRVRDPDVYLLAAALVPQEAVEPVRAALRGLLLAGQRKLHWHAESDKRRRQMVAVIAELEALHLVVVRCGRPGEHPERRRRKCLERLLPELTARGIEAVQLEARERKQNAADAHLLEVMRAKQMISGPLRMDHVPGAAEELLWLADATLGALTARRLGRPEFFAELAGLVEIITEP
jgi:hypothetical protein